MCLLSKSKSNNLGHNALKHTYSLKFDNQLNCPGPSRITALELSKIDQFSDVHSPRQTVFIVSSLSRFHTLVWHLINVSNQFTSKIHIYCKTIKLFSSPEYRLLDSLVVECWHQVLEVPCSILIQGPLHTKMVPVVLLFDTQH